jgi:YcxB-like protein
VKDEITVSFSWTERDFVAVSRAWRLIQRPGPISRVAKTGCFLFLHLVVLVGIMTVYRAVSGDHARDLHITPLDIGIFSSLSLIAAYFLYANWYGVRRKLARAFRSSNLRNAKISYKFDQQWIEVSHPAAPSYQERFAWRFVDRFVEFRDGFLFFTSPTAYWLPKSAFTEPFEEIELAELAKSRVDKYEFVDKTAA